MNADFLVGGEGPRNTREWVIDTLVILGIAIAVGIFGLAIFSGVGCTKQCGPGPQPTPTQTVSPTPTPSPTPSTFAELRLTTRGSDFVREADPTYKMRKVIACCADTVGTGWPGLSDSFIEMARNQAQANLFHWRVGPFRTCNESEWAVTGGGAYVEAPDGRADLTQFNQPYWDALRSMAIKLGGYGLNLEVSVMDSWGIKTVKWASNSPNECFHPWHSAGNIQGQNHLTTAYQGTNPDAVQLAYIQKVYETVGDLQNVHFEAGTESDQLQQTGRVGKDIVNWELTMEALLRQYEDQHGYPHALFGTNFVGDASYGWLRNGRLSFQDIHRFTASATPVTDAYWDPDFKRPLVIDEINFSPAPEAVEMEAFVCYARANGSYYALWRGEMPTNQWKAAMSLTAQDSINGCSEKMKLGCPYDVPPVSRVSCKPHGGAKWDCTPLSSRGPILPEGKPTRGLCEQVAAGFDAKGGVGWSVTPIAGGSIVIAPGANRWQYYLTGTKGATGTLHCKLPKLADACGYTVTVQ
jgi:hypothetical protein